MLAQGLSALRPLNKAALVVAGYLLAILAACLVVSIHYVATDGPDRQASSGMYSFADGLLFLAVFGFASIPASCAALCFLRQVQRFWSALSFVALSIASTGLVALYAYFVRPSAIADSVLYIVVTLWPIRVLIAPLLAAAFLISGLFAPSRSARIAIFVAAALEALVFASVAIHFVLTNRVLASLLPQWRVSVSIGMAMLPGCVGEFPGLTGSVAFAAGPGFVPGSPPTAGWACLLR